MSRTLSALIGLLVGAGGTTFFFGFIAPSKPPTPQEVVLHSIEYLRRADFRNLRKCYTDSAWEILAESIPTSSALEAISRLKSNLLGLGSIEIESVMIRSNNAVVEAVLEHEEGAEREIFQLVRSPIGWRIN